MSDTIGYTITTALAPLGGVGTPIAPPTYDGGQHAVSRGTPILTPTGQVDTHADGTPRRGDAVVVNSVAAEAHAVSAAMRAGIERITGQRAPGIYVDAAAVSGERIDAAAEAAARSSDNRTGLTDEEVAAELRMALDDLDISTWTASHRHADALIRSAIGESGKQVWGGDPLGEVLRSLRAEDGDTLVRTLPNAAALGFWLSARSPRRHRLARSLTGQVIGYGVSAHRTGYGKSDALGAVPNTAKVAVDGEGFHYGKGDKPSVAGFGTLTHEPETTAFTAETILRTATVSVRAMHAQITASDESLAMLADLSLMAALDSADGAFYRSGTDLIPLSPDAITVTAIAADGSRKVIAADTLRSEVEKRLTGALPEFFVPARTAVLGDAPLRLLAHRIVADAGAKE